MSSSKDQDPNDWYGTRTPVVMKNSCSWCLDGFHESCAHEIVWYEKMWICPCSCNKDWKPLNLVVERKRSK